MNADENKIGERQGVDCWLSTGVPYDGALRMQEDSVQGSDC